MSKRAPSACCQATTGATMPAAFANAPKTSTTTRAARSARSEEHTSELQSQFHVVCRHLLEKNTGLNSFVRLFSDSDLPSRLWTTLVFSLGALVIALPSGLLSAIVLNNLHRFNRSVRSLFLLRWLM